MKISSEHSGPVDAIIEPLLAAARIPGAAIAIVVDGEVAMAKGYGYRDLYAKLPLTARTAYPIASTTKAINATLLGMLVDEGVLEWDVPVRHYLPRFRLHDLLASAHVTLRDLITMRTGLPRHDMAWIDNPISRAQLLDCLPHLQPSAGFRERFQYNNITATLAGYVAEVVMRQSWEDLVQSRIFGPLDMHASSFGPPATKDVTRSYHENRQRELIETERRADGDTAPSGSAIHSTVTDMARWAACNLNSGRAGDRRLIKAQTLIELHSPQMVLGADPAAPTPSATYAMGWFVDTYGSYTRVSHGGYLRDVNTDVSLFPQCRIGVVSFLNFGCSIPARLVNQQVFDRLMGRSSTHSFSAKLLQYEQRIEAARRHNASAPRVRATSPSHDLSAYVGIYSHAGYGRFQIEQGGKDLVLRRNLLVLPLEHWHYDSWVAQDNDIFTIQGPHPFDRTSRLTFTTNEDGEISALKVRLEPTLAAIELIREPRGTPSLGA